LKFFWVLLHAGAERLLIIGCLNAALPFLDLGEPLAQLIEDFGLLRLKLPSLSLSLSALSSIGSVLARGNRREC